MGLSTELSVSMIQQSAYSCNETRCSTVEQIITVLLDQGCHSTVLKDVTSPGEAEQSSAWDQPSHFLSENKAHGVAPLFRLSRLWPVHCFFTA